MNAGSEQWLNERQKEHILLEKHRKHHIRCRIGEVLHEQNLVWRLLALGHGRRGRCTRRRGWLHALLLRFCFGYFPSKIT